MSQFLESMRLKTCQELEDKEELEQRSLKIL